MIKEKLIKIAVFIACIFLDLFIFFLFAYFSYFILHYILNKDIPYWGQLIIWAIGFGLTGLTAFFKFARKHYFLALMFTIAIVYLLTLVFVSNDVVNNFASSIKELAFVFELLLLPFSVKSAVKEANK